MGQGPVKAWPQIFPTAHEVNMATLQPGDPAPPFELEDQTGDKVRLADFKGQKLLLYFYPKADTPGCTKQACSIRDARAELADLGGAALGISPRQSHGPAEI
jgi:thioredoxin-dependent peroxiredoxin